MAGLLLSRSHVCAGFSFVGLYEPYGKAAMNVEEPACNIDYIRGFFLFQTKETGPSGRNSALWVLLSLCLVAERKSNAKFFTKSFTLYTYFFRNIVVK